MDRAAVDLSIPPAELPMIVAFARTFRNTSSLVLKLGGNARAFLHFTKQC